MNLLFLLLSGSIELGFTVAIVGFGIVLFSLSILFAVFSNIPRIINMKLKKKRSRKTDKESDQQGDFALEGNVTAAISMALHLYFSEQHDEESNIVTIKRVRRAYSPWSSKIYSVTRNWPKN